MACQEAVEAKPEKKEPIDRATAILEKTEATDLKANPEEVESELERQEVPKEDAIVKPVKRWKKQHRNRHLAAGGRGEPKELTREDYGSWRKMAAACRKLSRCAAMAWRKGNVFRKIQTQGNCGPRKELAPAGRRMTYSTKVAWRRGHDRKRYDQDSVVQETQKGWTFEKRRSKGPECNSGIRDRSLSSYEAASE
jgi:hypothetical protein